MPSHKATQILKSRTDLTEQQIYSLSESGAWKRIYELDQHEKLAKAALSVEQICFTGFGASERAALIAAAQAAGFEVKDSVTMTLKYLCVGPNAGPSKTEKARRSDIAILSVEEFRSICER